MPRVKGKPSKAAFVKSFPTDASLDTIIAKAKDQGMALSRSDIHRVRWVLKNQGTKAHKRKPGRPAASKAAPLKPVALVPPVAAEGPQRRRGDGADREFVTLALRVGLERSRALLDQLEEKIVELVI